MLSLLWTRHEVLCWRCENYAIATIITQIWRIGVRLNFPSLSSLTIYIVPLPIYELGSHLLSPLSQLYSTYQSSFWFNLSFWLPILFCPTLGRIMSLRTAAFVQFYWELSLIQYIVLAGRWEIVSFGIHQNRYIFVFVSLFRLGLLRDPWLGKTRYVFLSRKSWLCLPDRYYQNLPAVLRGSITTATKGNCSVITCVCKLHGGPW